MKTLQKSWQHYIVKAYKLKATNRKEEFMTRPPNRHLKQS